MKEFDELQIGHFLTYDLWEDAIKLLSAQLLLKHGDKAKKIPASRHFNTLNFFYYERLSADYKKLHNQNYFNTFIASNLFYGLTEEIFFLQYPLPKNGSFGIRKYSFFSYPLILTYYSIGLYLLKLSNQYLSDIGYILDCNKAEDYENKKVVAFYGGRLNYHNNNGKLELPNLSYEHLYYWNYYVRYRNLVLKKSIVKISNRAFISLDVQNYFENISIPILLNLIDGNNRIDNQSKRKFKFDENTKRIIEFFFQFLSENRLGIPQGDNNIISSFLGYFYLVFGDNCIIEIISRINKENKNIITNFQLFRYVDDIYILLDFKNQIEKPIIERLLFQIIEEISVKFYSQLNLRFNQKCDIFFNDNPEDKKRLYKSLKKVSIGYDEFISQQNSNSKNKEENKPQTISLETTLDIKEILKFFEKLPDLDKAIPIKELVDLLKNEEPQTKIDIAFKELKKLKTNSNISLLKSQNEFNQENIKNIYGKDANESKTVENLLSKKENKENLNQIFSDFPFDLVKLSPHLLIILILKSDDKIQKNFYDFLINKRKITIVDTDVIIKFLCQNNFDLVKFKAFIQKLKDNEYFKPIIEKFQSKRIILKKSGYFNLEKKSIKYLSKHIKIIEQIRLRIFNEKISSFSVALNHLVNEFQTICYELDDLYKTNGKQKDYDSDNVVEFLKRQNIPGDLIPTLKNMFKRRNINQISHSGNDEIIAYAVAKPEYLIFRKCVSETLDYLSHLMT